MEIQEANPNTVSSMIRTDVTAVKLWGDFVLAGIGSWIHIYKKSTAEFVLKLQALAGQKIYGFRTSENSTQILVFGGKQFTVILLDCTDFKGVTKLLEPIVCDDWLHDGVWIQKNEVAVLTAHNVVKIWNTAHKTLLKTYRSEDNSILYSGLLVPLTDDILVLAGTVFSQVIIHCCKGQQPLHRLSGHQGVIFSIACSMDEHQIVTTSDDRSVRIWLCEHGNKFVPYTRAYWENVRPCIQHILYGHTARVMRSFITTDMIISVGEDSGICFWALDGKLLKTTPSHQGAAIWSLDVDQTHLVTGGGDNAVIVHPLSVASKHCTYEDIQEHAKKVFFTAQRNILILYEDHELAYYDVELKSVTNRHKLEHESTFILSSLSSCKQLLAIADMNGNVDVFAENCKGGTERGLINLLKTKLDIGKVMSMQWAGNRHLVLCSETGLATVLASQGKLVETLVTFQLPPSKDSWLTAAAISPNNKMFVLGARNGNIHICIMGQKSPVKTLYKVHGRYGPQMIMIKNNRIVTTGRDGSIKHFAIIGDSKIAYLNSIQVPFTWVEKFLDKNENIICGFRERDFVVFGIEDRSTLFEVPCGGGHRSWDAVRYIQKVNDTYEEFIILMYLKTSTDPQSSSLRSIHLVTFNVSQIVSKTLIHGSHSKEINCLKCLKRNVDKSTLFFISGGEDTTLRITLRKELNSSTAYHDKGVFRHLSNVRTLKTCSINENKTLIVSAGGRAQICIKVMEFDNSNEDIRVVVEELIDYQIKGTDKERKGNQTWRDCAVDFDPETRVMDVEIIKENGQEYTIVAGCSDASLRFFKFEYYSTGNGSFKFIGEVKYHKTCIIKTYCFKHLSKNILITTTTRGEVAFWDFSEVLKEPNAVAEKTPFFLTRTNKSGINSISVKVAPDNEIILATGGDDNSVQVSCLRINMENLAVIISNKTSVDSYHCSEITGLEWIQDDFLISTSIDQRVTLAKWNRNSDQKLAFVEQTYSDVADIQGLNVIDETRSSVTVCVYGKGVQVLEINKR